MLPPFKSMMHTMRLRGSMWVVMVCIIVSNHAGLAQQQYKPVQKATKQQVSPKIWIAPAALIGAGIFMLTDNGLINQEGIRTFRNKHFYEFSTTADDYIQYAPLAIALGLKALGVSNEHNWAHMINLMMKSEVVMVFFVTWLKQATQIPRPDSGSPNSFPSGHTMQAFTAATLLHKEFGKKHPWVSVTGYTLASLVGVTRILRDRHWASDVLVGAGLGILLTQLVYLVDERERNKKNSIKVSVGHLPNGGNGLTLSIPIR